MEVQLVLWKSVRTKLRGGSAAAQLNCSQVSLILPQIWKGGRKVVTFR